MKQENVYEDRAKEHQGHRNVTIGEEQGSSDRLQEEYRYKVVRHKQGAEVLSREPGGRGHGDKMEEPIQTEGEEQQAEEYSGR